MTEENDNEKGLTFRDEILSKYHKIPFDPEMDPKDLNEELADILIMHAEIRDILKKKQNKWKVEDFKKAAEILGKYFADWEINKVLEAYAPEAWKNLDESLKTEIKEKYYSRDEQSAEDDFNLGEIYPFRVSKNGIEKYFKYSRKDSQEVEGWETITITPVILNSIGACMDDDSFLYQIKYKTITGDICRKWVAPEILLTSSIKEMVNYGLQFVDSDQNNLKSYFKQLLAQTSHISWEYTARKNGWKKEDSIMITGSYAHTAQGRKDILALTEEIATAYQIKGSKKEWIETMTPLLEYDLIRLKCYATVAALLIRFIGVRSFVLHNYYESSGLKSISMQLAASMLGNPLELIKDADSTR